MRSIAILTLLLLGFSQPAFALSGKAFVYDGDTIRISGQSIRLWGIDAAELTQSCKGAPCGQMAKYKLVTIIGGRDVTCEPRGKSYQRVVALCRADGRDIGKEMIRAGMAFESIQYSGGAYTADEDDAREKHAGVWGMNAMSPTLWRMCRAENSCISRKQFLEDFRPIRGRIAPFDAAYALDYAPRVKRRGVYAVNAEVNRRPYQPDTKRDQVLAPDDFWKHGGDCDKFALTKMLELRAQGYRKMVYLVLQERDGPGAHAVLALPENGIMLALDNRYSQPVPLTTLYQMYKPVYFIDVDSGVLWHASKA